MLRINTWPTLFQRWNVVARDHLNKHSKKLRGEGNRWISVDVEFDTTGITLAGTTYFGFSKSINTP